jgi:hypothetical protein
VVKSDPLGGVYSWNKDTAWTQSAHVLERQIHGTVARLCFHMQRAELHIKQSVDDAHREMFPPPKGGTSNKKQKTESFVPSGFLATLQNDPRAMESLVRLAAATAL